MCAPIARPNWIARSTAVRFITGSAPGSARSTGDVCVFGSAPNCVGEPLKILLLVVNCACVSRPITTSHCMFSSLARVGVACCLHIGHRSGVGRLAQMPVGRLLVLVCDVQQLRFGEIVADQLQADRALAV